MLSAGRDPKDLFTKDGLLDDPKKALAEKDIVCGTYRTCPMTAYSVQPVKTDVSPKSFTVACKRLMELAAGAPK